MTRAQATDLLEAVRRAGGELVRGLDQSRQAHPPDLRKWELATANALGAMQDELLNPILAEHPEITPVELGGPPRR